MRLYAGLLFTKILMIALTAKIQEKINFSG
jgi:hypothetical protein